MESSQFSQTELETIARPLSIVGGFTSNFGLHDPTDTASRPLITSPPDSRVWSFTGGGKSQIIGVNFHVVVGQTLTDLTLISDSEAGSLDVSFCRFTSEGLINNVTTLNINAEGGTSTISNNEIYLRVAMLGNAIVVSGSDPDSTIDIHNNVIDQGTGTYDAMGVMVMSAIGATIRNNTIAVMGLSFAAVRLNGSNASRSIKIENNLFVLSRIGDTGVLVDQCSAVYMPGYTSLPSTFTFRNNNMSGLNLPALLTGATSSFLSDLNPEDANSRIQPIFLGSPFDSDSRDYRLSAASAATLKSGGLDGTQAEFSFANDVLGIKRSSGAWSRGAFQFISDAP